MTISATLAPFIVWLASRERDEALRRRLREHVERYLRWAEAHYPAAALAVDDDHDRRCDHYLQECVTDPGQLAEARMALDRYREHRSIMARTAIIGR